MQLTSQEQIYLKEQQRRRALYRIQQIRIHNINVIKEMMKRGVNPADFPSDIYNEYCTLCNEGYGSEFKVFFDEEGNFLIRKEEDI